MSNKRALSTLGKNINQHRVKAGLTQRQLSDKTGIALSRLVMVENGNDREVDLVELTAIAKTLNVRLVQLVEGVV